MRVLVTGAAGFVGKNLVENLKAIRDGKNRTWPFLVVEQIYTYDVDDEPDFLDAYCRDCDFVLNLAGVNRPHDPEDYMRGNRDFSARLLDALRRHENRCPVMLSSSIQASLSGRFADSRYGRSKLAAEELLFQYARETGAEALVYRFPNLAGKWIKPNYNSAVATFCHNIANDLPVAISDPALELELVFIDDLLEEIFDALEGHPHRCDYPAPGETVGGALYDGMTPLWRREGKYCGVPVSHKATLGEIVNCLRSFHDQPQSLILPRIAPGSLEKKLYSMYVSYLPQEKVVFDLVTNRDERGTFTEVLKTRDHGQVSVNVTKPGITKGQHWHNSKWELFVVVSGHGLIRERKIGTNEVMEFEVSGERLQAVHMLPGYTHSLINLSDRDDLVTLMWANEMFDSKHPDTFYEPLDAE